MSHISTESKSFRRLLPLFQFSRERRTEKNKPHIIVRYVFSHHTELHVYYELHICFSVALSTCGFFPLTSSFCKPTVALVYGALGCMTISGFREDIVACVVLMLESNRAEHSTVRLLTGASEGMTPV